MDKRKLENESPNPRQRRKTQIIHAKLGLLEMEFKATKENIP